jgi:DNA repair exonuclease SbcCD nuclease subunit
MTGEPHAVWRGAFLGDVHLSPTTPASRRDDYGETCLRKLEFVLRRCWALGVTDLFCVGDLFNTPTVSMSYVNRVIRLLRRYHGITFYVIPGNHDLPYHRLDRLEDTALGNLVLSGVVRWLERFRTAVDGEGKMLEVCGAGVGRGRPERGSNARRSILIDHAYWKAGADDYVLPQDEATALGHDLYILGHDHLHYPMARVEDGDRAYHVARPGSLMRATSHFHQVLRTVQFIVVEFEDGGLYINEEPVECLPPDEVYSSTVFAPTQILTRSVDKMIERMESREKRPLEGASITEMLTSIPSPPEVRDYVQSLLRERGIA